MRERFCPNSGLPFHRPQMAQPVAREFLRVGLYVEGVRSLDDVEPLWKEASSKELDHLCIDLVAWLAPVHSATAGLACPNFLSDAVLPLDVLCTCVALRVLVPGGFNLEQSNFLNEVHMDLRTSRAKAIPDIVGRQMQQASLFCKERSRPVVVLPYARNMSFEYAERIMSYAPGRLEGGHEIINMQSGRCGEFWIHVPLAEEAGDEGFSMGTGDVVRNSSPTELAVWKWWLGLKQSVDSAIQVGVALEIAEDLPDDLSIVDLWKCEPIRALFIPTGVFVSGEDGSPVLPPRHRDVVLSLLELYDVQISLRPGGILDKSDVGSLVPYARYLRTLRGSSPLLVRPAFPVSLFPPMDTVHQNLSVNHYSDFELDTKKYADYEEALHQYIETRQAHADSSAVFVVAVIGCGLGPLVNVALNIARVCRIKVRVYALEKNPATWPYLEEKTQNGWSGFEIIIVKHDVRLWEPTEQFDAILSELLGSFGDNELCPEILSCTEKWLKPEGVYVPQRYTSFLCPVSLPKVYEQTAYSSAEWTKRLRQTVYGFDVDCFRLLANPEEIFNFCHPSDAGKLDKSDIVSSGGGTTVWSAERTFCVNSPGMLHGFSGYFEAMLYGTVRHSLVPGSRTEGLVTWKNIWFPLVDPVMLEKGQLLRLKFWRHCSPEFVWYEWMLLEPVISRLHNAGGTICRMPCQ